MLSYICIITDIYASCRTVYNMTIIIFNKFSYKKVRLLSLEFTASVSKRINIHTYVRGKGYCLFSIKVCR